MIPGVMAHFAVLEFRDNDLIQEVQHLVTGGVRVFTVEQPEVNDVKEMMTERRPFVTLLLALARKASFAVS